MTAWNAIVLMTYYASRTSEDRTMEVFIHCASYEVPILRQIKYVMYLVCSQKLFIGPLRQYYSVHLFKPLIASQDTANSPRVAPNSQQPLNTQT